MEKKTKLQLLKEIWKNKRYRALIILGIYFVFFIFVFFVIQTMYNNDKPEYKSSLDNYCLTNNYDFTYDIDNKMFFKGNSINGKEQLFFNDEVYYIDNDKVYYYKNNLKEVNNKLNYLQNKHICELIKMGNKISETNNIKSDTLEITYDIDNNKYLNYIELESNKNNNVSIITYEKNKKINKVLLKLLDHDIIINYFDSSINEVIIPKE